MNIVKSATRTATVIATIIFILLLVVTDSGSICNFSSINSSGISKQERFEPGCCSTHPLFGDMSGDGCSAIYNNPENEAFGYTIGELVTEPKKYQDLYPESKKYPSWKPYLSFFIRPITIAALFFLVTFIVTLSIFYVVNKVPKGRNEK